MSLQFKLIQPARGWRSVNLREVWVHRELVYFLTWREVKVRYKQTLFGAAWAILQPFTTAVVFTIVFGYLVGISTGPIPYPVFSLTALIPWMYFSRSLERVSNSVVENSHLLTKVYFPRLAIPFGSLLSGLVDLGMALIVLLALMAVFGIAPTSNVLLLPFLVLLAMATALGVGLWASALNVYYRDVKYVIPFLLQVWMYATPIIYPISMVPEQLRYLYSLNPMVGVVEGFRWVLLGQQSASYLPIGVSALVSLVLLITGLFYFARMEDAFADHV